MIYVWLLILSKIFGCQWWIIIFELRVSNAAWLKESLFFFIKINGKWCLNINALSCFPFFLENSWDNRSNSCNRFFMIYFLDFLWRFLNDFFFFHLYSSCSIYNFLLLFLFLFFWLNFFFLLIFFIRFFFNILQIFGRLWFFNRGSNRFTWRDW